LPVAQALPYDDVKGAVSYLLSSRDPLMTVTLHDLYSGDVSPRARFSPAVDSIEEDVTTRAVSFGRSVAIVLADPDHSWIAFVPYGRAPQGWIPGEDVAWLSETELVVRSKDGSMLRLQAGTDNMTTKRLDPADDLFQTAAGAVVRRGHTLESLDGPTRKLEVPAKSEVLAVSPDVSRAVLDAKAPVLWDGRESKPVHVYDYGKVLGASFEPSGERAALLFAEDGELTLAVVMPRGNSALKPLGKGPSCPSAPAWDGTGRWIYAATSDGVLHAVESSGGRIEAIKTHGVGCGVAWLDVA
jgi:hypothetical protein